MKPINTLCGQNAESLIVKADGTYSYHLVLRVRSGEYSTCLLNQQMDWIHGI
jgi:hypothetical protein